MFNNIFNQIFIQYNNLFRDAKSLVRHLLTIDVTKRYGCMKAGVKDIIDHRFYRDFDWRGLLYMNLDPPYTPKIK